MCRSKSVATNSVEVTDSIATLDIDPDTAFLDNITPRNLIMQWSATIQVNGKPMTFKLDTGAEVTAISPAAYQQFDNIQLETSLRTIETTSAYDG